jgi:putative hydrolase of the HAD superfamily
MSKPTITTLFLDIGGVLLTNGWDRAARRAAVEKFNLDAEEMNERHHLTFDTYEEGKLTLEEYLKRVVFYKDQPFSPEEFRAFMLSRSEALPRMIGFVRALKNRFGLKVAALSNEGRELTVHRIRTFKLGEFIDFFISSCFVHFRKPDADIYRIAMDIAQVQPVDIVYIEDRPMYVDVARGFGLRGVVHEGFETTRAALADFGLSLDDSDLSRLDSQGL